MAINYIENMQTNSFQDVSLNTLRKADWAIPVPFVLKLHEQEQALYCEKVIRIIPGKRIVAFGIWENKPIVAKLFFERGKAKVHSHRDVSGIQALMAVNIPTPPLFFQGMDQSKRIHVLIFERIADSCSLDVLWQEKNDIEEVTPLMRAVTIELATQHVLGIQQRDLHLKNFLITSKHIYTLDGGSIERSDELLPKKASLEHLSLFFSQLGVGTDELQKYLFDTYAHARGWIVRPADLEFLHQSTQKYNAQRWQRYQKKIMRISTAFNRINQLTALILYDRDYQSDTFKKFLDNPDVYIAKPDTQVLKMGRSSTVVKLRLDNRVFVVKRYNIKNGWHWLRRSFRSTRAIKSWQLAHRLRWAGVPTAKPIACIEKRFLGLRSKSYFVMEYVEGKNAGEFFSQFQPEKDMYLRMAKRILKLLQQLTELRITHGDLKISNIIIHHEHPVLIDLDGMQEHQHTYQFHRAYKKEIARFMKNWESFPSVRSLFQQLINQ